MLFVGPSRSAKPRGSVVDHLSADLHTPSGETVTMAEQSNHGLMFRKTGESIAMGNASDEIKAAIAVTASYDDECFA
jgi:hydroxymethylpyrimidine pyrophosphatase-like HAD family hydrolase